MPGSWISIRIRSGRSAPASAMPPSAVPASRTWCCAFSSRNLASFRLAGLSSMINIFAMSRSCFPIRQPHDEFRAAADLAAYRQRAAVQLDQLFHQRQSEAGAVVAARQTAVELDEGLEQARQ